MKTQKLILDYIPLANKIAWQKSKKTPNSITFEDLKSVAYLGLVEAANKFDPNKGPFYIYASIKINGHIIDHLRFYKKNDINKMIEQDSFIEYSHLDLIDFFDFIESKLDKISSKIIKMYYLEEKTMKEIGKAQGITESRVCQILKKCNCKLKNFLGGYL
jgi:RNA polymerase sigma factor for flagellar operon FliA